MPQGSSGEWHTGEVVNLCEAYGFIRISKDGKSEDIFMHYHDLHGFRPQIGDQVSFELATDAKLRDRKKAVAVEYSEDRSGAPARVADPEPRRQGHDLGLPRRGAAPPGRARRLHGRRGQGRAVKGTRPCPPTTTADHSSNASCASIPHYPPTTPCARLFDALQPAV